jgi:hypothetical protein
VPKVILLGGGALAQLLAVKAILTKTKFKCTFTL